MKSIAEVRASSMTDEELSMMIRQGSNGDKKIAARELAGRVDERRAGAASLEERP